VLSGLIAAFLAQGLEPFDGAVAAVFVHAEAALALQAARGRAGVLPRDLLDELPAAQERTRRVLESRRDG
jgi:NAD(P)H-hydrate repair Nnr-like enzyme with NAD(P)H-hydrate dehydratase domain